MIVPEAAREWHGRKVLEVSLVVALPVDNMSPNLELLRVSATVVAGNSSDQENDGPIGINIYDQPGGKGSC